MVVPCEGTSDTQRWLWSGFDVWFVPELGPIESCGDDVRIALRMFPKWMTEWRSRHMVVS